MIYTVTFNPAIDYVIKVDNLTLGQVNRTTREYIFCGGKGINVSHLLANLGVDSVGLTFLPVSSSPIFHFFASSGTG